MNEIPPLIDHERQERLPIAMVFKGSVLLDIGPATPVDLAQARALRDWLTALIDANRPPATWDIIVTNSSDAGCRIDNNSFHSDKVLPVSSWGWGALSATASLGDVSLPPGHGWTSHRTS